MQILKFMSDITRVILRRSIFPLQWNIKQIFYTPKTSQWALTWGFSLWPDGWISRKSSDSAGSAWRRVLTFLAIFWSPGVQGSPLRKVDRRFWISSDLFELWRSYERNGTSFRFEILSIAEGATLALPTGFPLPAQFKQWTFNSSIVITSNIILSSGLNGAW